MNEEIEEQLERIAKALEKIENGLSRRNWLSAFFKMIFFIISCVMAAQLIFTDIDHHDLTDLIDNMQEMVSMNMPNNLND